MNTDLPQKVIILKAKYGDNSSIPTQIASSISMERTCRRICLYTGTLMEDECPEHSIAEYVGLRSKMYSIIETGSENVRKRF